MRIKLREERSRKFLKMKLLTSLIKHFVIITSPHALLSL